MDYRNTALWMPACDLRALEHGDMKGTACTLNAAGHGAVNSAISQDCSLRNDQDCKQRCRRAAIQLEA